MPKITNFDNLVYLHDLTSYPGSNRHDKAIFVWPASAMPGKGNTKARRIWLKTPEGSPALYFEGKKVCPVEVHEGVERWIDYGVEEIAEGSHTLLEIEGMPAYCGAEALLAISVDPDCNMVGLSTAAAETRFFGLPRSLAGTSSISPCRLFAGQAATFTLRYHAGPEGLRAGCKVRFSVPFFFSLPQAEDPEGAGYTRILKSDCEAAIDYITGCYNMHARQDIVVRIDSDLEPEQSIILSYRTEKGTIVSKYWAGEINPHHEEAVPPFWASVSTGPWDRFAPLEKGNCHTLEIVPREPEHLHLFLPGRRRRGETLSLRGTVTDRYGNIPQRRRPFTMNFELVLLTADHNEQTLEMLPGLLEEHNRFSLDLPDLAPGVYRAEARRAETGEVVARSNPLEILADNDPRLPLYWGGVHAHSEMSDGINDFTEMHRRARDDGALDFFTSADHEMHLTPNDWAQMQDIAQHFNAPGQFCTLCGYESLSTTIFTSRERLEELRIHVDAGSIQHYFDHFKDDEDVVMGPHGHRDYLAEFKYHEPKVNRFLNIYSVWGACDLPGTELTSTKLQPEKYAATARDYLDTGARFGFQGGGDCHCGRGGFSNYDRNGQGTTTIDQYPLHDFHDGLTAAIMPALDRQDLVACMRQRHTYATSGSRILLDFSLGGVNMGEEGAVPGSALCRFSVHACGEIREISIVRNGEVVKRLEGTGLDMEGAWEDSEAPEGESYYWLHVVQKDAEAAWSSPIWIERSAR